MTEKEKQKVLDGNFVFEFERMAERVHATAIENGWWEGERNDGDLIALIHSDLSEAMDALRHGNLPDDKVPEFNGAEAELADAVISIMDMGEARGWRIADAIIAKAAMNKKRPVRNG